MKISGRALSTIVCIIAIFIFATVAEAALDRERLTIGGEVRERYEFRDDADFNKVVDDALSFISSRIRLHAGYEVTPDLVIFFQMQDSRLFGSETSTASNEKNLDLHQGYLQLKNLGPWVLTLGRQEMIYGDQKLVGNFGWSNIGRSFDGIKMGYDTGRVRTDLWLATIRKFANTGADPTFVPTPTVPSVSNRKEQTFFGMYTTYSGLPEVSIEPYVLFLWDTGSGGLITDPAAQDQRRVTLGLRLAGKAMAESIDYTAEGAYQLGGIQSKDIAAYAGAVKLGYNFTPGLPGRLGIEFDYASGDDNPADGDFKTFENLFPTNHIHYGYMDYVGWRNMQDLRFSLGVKPTQTASISLDYHLFWLAREADHWYAASGRIFRSTPAGNSEKELGQEIDLVGYVVIKEKFRLEGGYGHFYPGQYAETNFPGASDDSDFVYLQAGVSF